METMIHDFLFGLLFGCGFFIAKGVLEFIAQLLSKKGT